MNREVDFTNRVLTAKMSSFCPVVFAANGRDQAARRAGQGHP